MRLRGFKRVIGKTGGIYLIEGARKTDNYPLKSIASLEPSNPDARLRLTCCVRYITILTSICRRLKLLNRQFHWCGAEPIIVAVGWM